MPRSRRRPQLAPGRIAAVLDGSLEPDFDELLDMIRATNPSRAGLAPEDRARRYATKAHLQSLLLEHHGDAVAVFPTARPGVVGLRRRSGRGDACHAVVRHLRPEARQLVTEALPSRHPGG